MTDALVTVAPDNEAERKRKLTLLRAIGLDRVSPEERELALAIAKRYELDLLLKHIVIIEGRAAITRDGLLHIAHRDGHFDGIETTEPTIREYEGLGRFWTASATVWRTDMSHGFTYTGRFPFEGRGPKQVMKVYGPEMATKVAEVMALRRAFDVAMPTQEERWDAEVPAAEPEPPKSLAEKVAEKAAAVTTPSANVYDYEAAVTAEFQPMPIEVSAEYSVLDEAGEQDVDTADLPIPEPANPKAEAATTTAKQTTPTTETRAPTTTDEQCGSYSKLSGDRCRLAEGHGLLHRTANEAWHDADGKRA